MADAGTLPAKACDRLAKLLGMLGSDQVGERAAAALKADAFVREHGLSWRDVANALQNTMPSTNRQRIAALLRHPEWLTQWEDKFLRSVSRFGALSPAQSRLLNQIESEADERRKAGRMVA